MTKDCHGVSYLSSVLHERCTPLLLLVIQQRTCEYMQIRGRLSTLATAQIHMPARSASRMLDSIVIRPLGPETSPMQRATGPHHMQ